MTIDLNIVQTSDALAPAPGPFARPGSYDDACKAAATAQGLDPLAYELDRVGVVHGIEQTGGMCMVLTVRTDAGTYAVIHDADSDTDPEPWLIGFYPGDAWAEGGESTSDLPRSLMGAVAHLLHATTKTA